MSFEAGAVSASYEYASGLRAWVNGWSVNCVREESLGQVAVSGWWAGLRLNSLSFVGVSWVLVDVSEGTVVLEPVVNVLVISFLPVDVLVLAGFGLARPALLPLFLLTQIVVVYLLVLASMSVTHVAARCTMPSLILGSVNATA